ncbi:MAG: glycosyltransferase [Planctomycetes bacterium]|nr:glycosyltransferase [Planctomycetota bacterium]
MRVLHLVDPGSPGGGACTLRLMAEPMTRLRSIEQDVIVIGHRGHVELAVRCGVRPVGAIAPTLGLSLSAQRALRRAIAERERRQGRYDVIHAWTLSSAALARTAAPGRALMATAMVGPTTEPAAHGQIALLRRRPAPVLAGSGFVREEFREMGLDGGVVSVLPPAVTTRDVDERQRATLRQRWGATDATLVVGVPAQPIGWSDARRAVEVLARLAYTERDIRFVVHHSANRRVQTTRWLEQQGFRDLLVVDDTLAEPWRVVAGFDAALLMNDDLNTRNLSTAGSPWSLLTGGGRRARPASGVLPALWAMAAGVVVIAEESAACAEIIADEVSGLLIPAGDINAAADRLGRLHDDRALAERLGAGARAAVNEGFTADAFCARLGTWYERADRGAAEAASTAAAG